MRETKPEEKVSNDRTPTTSALRLVVIGNGMVGQKFIERLVSEATSSKFEITVLGGEPRPAYDRVHLTDFFKGKQAADLQLSSEEWYAKHQIGLHLGDPVVELDPARKTIKTQQAKTFAYDLLVLATGSRPFVPPIPGNNAPNVFVYRTIEDLEQIQAAATNAKRAAVIGGGLLGLEAAEALKQLNLETHVVERNIGLMSQQLPVEGSQVLQHEIRQRGLQFHLSKNTKSIKQQNGNLLLEFQNGEALLADLIVIASGIRPCDELARQAGLAVHARGGIEIDDQLQTSVQGIYAIGECANHEGTLYGLVAPGYRMADALARQLAGGKASFTGDFLAARLKFLGINVATFGDHQGEGTHLEHRSRTTYRKLVVRRNRIVGATVVGPCDELNRIQGAVDGKSWVWQWDRRRFERSGTLWSKTESVTVAQWPEKALVCNCLNISRGRLSHAIATEGCESVDSLSKCTGASTVCGSCRPLLANLVGAPDTTAPTKGYTSLLAASVLTVIMAAILSLTPPIQNAVTVTQRSISFLWTDGFWKLASGYTLVGLCVLSLLLSLRKRIKRIQWGNFGFWRAAHAILGVSTLFILITHTGFRLGHNLNFVLMMNFLGLAIVGALAGLFTALETRLTTPWARRVRQLGTLLHIGLFLPLPVLIFFHAFKAYYY